MAETIFFSQCEASVVSAVKARKAIYASENRNSTDHIWLFKKMAFASARAFNELSKKTATLTTPKGGGIGAANSLYKGATPTVDGRFLPRPHINTVKISNEGDFGSIKKCEMAFTVYSRADLDKMQAFFDIGAKLTVKYGWKYSGGPFGKQGEFNGIIYNFAYQVNTSGGFDCTTHGIGEGIAMLASNVKAGVDSKGESYTDEVLNIISYTSLSVRLVGLMANAKELAENTIDEATGIGCVKMPTSWGAADNSTEKKEAKEAPAEEAPAEDVPKFYISLEKLVVLIKEKIIDTAAPKFKELTFKCDSVTTLGNMPSADTLVSANPVEMLFPGFCNYGALHPYTLGAYDAAFKAGDLSKTMLSIPWLVTELTELGKSAADKSKSTDATIAKFFKIIFDKIYQNSGTRFKLSLSANPKNEKEFLVVEVNYVPKSVLNVLELTAVTKDSICRSISLAAKIPSALSTMAYTKNANTLSDANGTGLSGLSGGTPPPPENPETAELTLTEIRTAIDSAPLTTTTITSLESALKRQYIGGNDPTVTNEAVAYPIDFSATIDGLEGFIFGNAITTNYLPSVYHDATGQKVAFTITKVEHTVSNNDWTTTLSTVCRIRPTA